MSPGGKSSGVAVAMMAAGGLLLYSGIRGYSILTGIQNLIVGVPIGTSATITPLSSGQDVIAQGVAPASGSPRQIGQAAAVLFGWTSANGEWDALDKLWTRESNWNPHAKNPSSGAYGIPQALPYTKMPQAAWPESAGGQSDAAQQIGWGLSYIAGRYGKPSAAWAHEQANSWY